MDLNVAEAMNKAVESLEGVAKSPATEQETSKIDVPNRDAGVEESPAGVEGEEKRDDKVADSGGVENDPLEDELKNVDPELRELLAKSDAEIRKAQLSVFKKMRASHDRRLSEIGEDKKLAEEIKGELSKYGFKADAISINGIKSLLQFDSYLNREPEKVIKELAEKYNLKVVKESEAEEQQEYYSPEEEKILKGQKTLENKIKDLEQRELTRQQEIAYREIDNLKNEKDDRGNLKRPYFDKVLPEMVELSKVNPKLSYHQLYEKAIWINDDIRNQIIESEKQSLIADREAKRKTEVAKAKSVSNQGLKSTPVNLKADSIEEIIKQTIMGIE